MSSGKERKASISPIHSRQLDFDPQSFVNVGSWLSAQERKPTKATSTQTSPPESTPRSPRYAVLGLLALVAVLLGTNAYAFSENRSWKEERIALQSRIATLEREAKEAGRAQAPTYVPDVPNSACPGGEILDTCWFKVGFGNCAKEAIDDPVGRVEGAWRFAWVSTVEIIQVVGETVASDFQQLGKELQSLGSAALNLLSCGSS